MENSPPPTMPAASEQGSSHARQAYRLTVNTYDRTATLLIALLVMGGCTVAGMLVVYFAKKTFPTIEPIPVVPVEATSQNANQGLADEPDPPGVEDAPDLSEPQLQDTLEALSTLISDTEMLLSDEEIDAEKEAGKGQGLGDSRMAGPGGDGVVERVPRAERFKIRFEPDSADEFARWLDYHKIEIGVLGRDNQVHYGYELSGAAPKTRVGDPVKDTRMYMSAADGPMPQLTMQLARKADVARHGPIVLLFYPFDVESILWTIEKKHAEGRDVNTIRETVFTVTRERDQFGFEVIGQKYF